MSKLDDKDLNKISGGTGELDDSGAEGSIGLGGVGGGGSGGGERDIPLDPENPGSGNRAIDD